MNSRKFLALAAAGALAVVLAGCGEATNTIVPAPWTANNLTVALPTAPSPAYIGMYEAQALGYFKQTDLNVTFRAPSAGVSDTLQPLYSGSVWVAVTSQPALLLARNDSEALVGVAAIVHGPLTKTVAAPAPKRSGAKSGSGSASRGTKAAKTSKTPAARTEPDTSLLPASLQRRTDLPTYDGLIIAVRKGTIVNHAPLIRRFVQAVARGYQAARRDPAAAVQALVTADPALGKDRALQEQAIRALEPSFFPSGQTIWGWQSASQWNAFGTWLTRQHLITNPNATPDASTNELLAGQGV